MRAMRRWSFLVVLVPFLSFAQDARALFEEGSALFARGAWREAAAKFEESYAARPLPLTRFNVARCWESAGQPLLAIDSYQAYLVLSPEAADRLEVEAVVRKLGKKLSPLGVQAVTVTALPVGALLLVDGLPKGLTPLTIELPAGRHLFRVEREGREAIERAVVLSLERPVVERFELPPAQGTPLAVAPQAVEPVLGISADDLEPPPAPPTSTQRYEPLRAPNSGVDSAFDATAPSDNSVRVHIDADNTQVRLYRWGRATDECRAPCDILIGRASDRFIIGGSGITPSSEIVLIDHQVRGLVNMKVRSGNAGALVAGTVIGGTLAIGALIPGIVFSVSSFTDSGGRVAAALAIGVGIVSAIVTIAMLIANQTHVSFPDEAKP
jgi:hypothetical protein